MKINLNKDALKYALWVNGEVCAMCFRYEQAEELLEMFGDDFDLAIIDLQTQETVFTKFA